jgi:NADH pyrophosphatase NudC (nudix superfamily)
MAKKINFEGLLGGISNAIEKVNDVKRTTGYVISNAAETISDFKRSSGSIIRTVEDVKRSGLFGKKNDGAEWVCECGTANKTRFCGGYGKPAPSEVKVVCPNCNWERPPENAGMQFCGNCGAQLEETSDGVE